MRHASELGVASVVFLKDGSRWVLTSNIEAPRVMTEELDGLGFKLMETRWYSPKEKARALLSIFGRRAFGSDDGTPNSKDVESVLPPLRMELTRSEMGRYRWLGRTAGRAMGEVCRRLRRGMSEEEMAGMLFAAMQARGVKASVMLVAADERIARFRHPIPTRARVRNAVMVVACARRWGLVCSLTRLVHFGRIPEETRRKHVAVTRVDARMILSSGPGVAYVDVFNEARRAYAEEGFAGEWTFHHQGGPTGYVEREFTVNPETGRDWMVRVGHAIAWNPSISGTKSEDSILVTGKGAEVVTNTPGWPCLKVRVKGRTVMRPDWLIRG